MIYIGIDPGLSGGIAILHDSGMALLAGKMPATERDVLDALACPAADGSPVPARAMVERVSAWPKMGVVSAFTFGKGYGGLLMALTAARIPFDLVTPQTWQKALGCLSGGDKTVTKRRAQQLFPQFTITHAIADSLLIAEYCRRIHQGGQRGKEEVRQGKDRRGKGRLTKLTEAVREGLERQAQEYEEFTAQSSAPRHGAGQKRPPRSDLRGHRGRA